MDYFGTCPQCQKHDGCIKVGSGHWYYCKEHKTKWCVGANLFSGWKEQTEDEQHKIYDDLGFGEFQSVEPRHRPEPTDGEQLLPAYYEQTIRDATCRSNWGPMMKDISHPVYNGRELVGTVVALEHGGFIALDGNGKRLGAFQSRIDAAKAVLAAPRDTDGELLDEIEARMKESEQ